MEKLKVVIKKSTCFFIDCFAWLMVLCFVTVALRMIKSNLFGTIIILLFAFFISPMRRKLLAKKGIKLKKKFVAVIGTVLFCMSMYQIGASALGATMETEKVEVVAEPEEFEEIERLEITEEKVQGQEQPEETETVVVESIKLLNVEEKTEEVQKESKETMETNLAVHFIDVGQGEATLFICDREAMLLDAGTNSSGTSIQLYLKKRGIANLKYLILTHPDEDHIGGADVIITKYSIENVFMTEYEIDTKAYEEVINALEYRWMQWSTPSVGSTYSLGGATFTVIAPNRSYDDVNDSSMGILVTHGNNKFLFTGDAESEAESDILRNGINLDCNVFHAGHHGSRTSNSSGLLKAATPEYVVVSCGEDNNYGHPHAGPMNDFRSMGAKLFRTDEQGTIVAESDGNSLTWNMSPTDSWKTGEQTENSQLRQSQTVTTQIPTPPPEFETELIRQPIGNNFAVNGKNGKIHMVGACSATGNGKQAMKEPVYFETFEQAESYSIQYHPNLDKRKCGNCYK